MQIQQRKSAWAGRPRPPVKNLLDCSPGWGIIGPVPGQTSPVIRFGPFEADPAARELRKNGVRLKLQDQPFRVLQMLLEKPGEVVTREELQERIWGEDTYVDFDKGLSTAVNKVRQTLGDSRSRPRFIETLPKVGYRFIGQISPAENDQGQQEPSDGIGPQPGRSPGSDPPAHKRWNLALALSLFSVLAAAPAFWLSREPADTWENPLEGARFTRLTDFAGVERDADISADGKYFVFLSDKDGPFDAWVGRIDGGEFVNLTNGRFPELSGPWVRNVGFTGDGGHVWLRVAERDPESNRILPPKTWLAPTLGGGQARPFLESSTSVAWSPDGARIAYQERAPGDPIVVADPYGGNPTRLFAREPGGHCHFPVWSPDGRFIYFSSGVSGDEWDIWRVPTAGGQAERMTNHNSRVGYPTPIDSRTLLYIATAEHGGGSVLYAMDVEQRLPHRVSSGLEQYTSLAADASSSGSSRRLVAALSELVGSLWSIPISVDIVDEEQVSPLPPPNVRATGPRLGPDFLLYLSSTGPADGLWKYSGDTAVELWKVEDGGLTFPPGLSPDGRRICFSYRKQDAALLYMMSVDGTNVRLLTEAFQVRSPPSWSPDGKWIVVSGDAGNGSSVFKVRADDGTVVRLVDSPSHYPVWSPDGNFILYADATPGGPTRPVKAITPDGRPLEFPELSVLRGSERYHFLPDGSGLVVLQGFVGAQNFWLFDLETGNLRQLTDLRSAEAINSFDVSPDGERIVFERVREESDVVLIELAGR